MNFAQVVDGNLAQTSESLPAIFGNITGFDLADAETLAANGWFAITDTPPALLSGEVVEGPTYVVTTNGVTAQYAVRNLTSGEVAASLTAAKTDMLSALQAAKTAALIAMPYSMNGQTYRITLGVQDQIDVQTQIAALASAPAGTTVAWELVNNVFVNLSVAELQALQAAGIAYVSSIYQGVFTASAQIDAAADQATLSTINISGILSAASVSA